MSAEILKTIREDDFVEYFLFPDIKSSDIELENYEQSLNTVLEQVNEKCSEFCADYLWHKDSFKVTPRYKNSNLLIDGLAEELPPHLHGISHYGDNIQDEWFMVSLIFHLTKEIPGVIGRIIDSDGEFLMIEAADHLPKWANPETCDKRVYISNGTMYLLTNSGTSNETTISEAIEKLRKNMNKFKVSSNVENCILDRIKDYPEKIKESLHRATLYVPIGVAAVLKENPNLISAAVLAFCNRDPIDSKVCRAMRYFPPENCVYMSAIFTKCLYAMLTHSSFVPDRRTGWSLPLKNSSNYKSHLLGVKLACGFEILAAQAKSSQSLETDKGWKSYYDSLMKKGYFQENIDGSQDYNKLLKIAQEYYIENRDSMKFAPKIGQEIVSILKRNEFDVDELKKEEYNLPTPDEDDWMNISPDELDEMLTKRYGIKKIFSANGNANAENFSSIVNEFLEQKSEFDGIDNDEAANIDLNILRPIKPKRTKSKNKDSDSPAHQANQSSTIDFDPDAFGGHVKHLLDLVIPEDKWDSNSDMSDYGEDDFDKNIEDMTNNKTNAQIKNELQSYMEQMDRELANTTIGKSFETKEPKEDEDDFDDIETFQPVNIDVNTLKNMMESYQSQVGGPGPAASLLGSMGIQMNLQSNSESCKSGSSKQTDV